jgi:hypothetical protein
MVSWLKKFFQRKIVSNVPSELAACEFNCRVGECLHSKWEQCERRLKAESQESRPV